MSGISCEQQHRLLGKGKAVAGGPFPTPVPCAAFFFFFNVDQAGFELTKCTSLCLLSADGKAGATTPSFLLCLMEQDVTVAKADLRLEASLPNAGIWLPRKKRQLPTVRPLRCLHPRPSPLGFPYPVLV